MNHGNNYYISHLHDTNVYKLENLYYIIINEFDFKSVGAPLNLRNRNDSSIMCDSIFSFYSFISPSLLSASFSLLPINASHCRLNTLPVLYPSARCSFAPNLPPRHLLSSTSSRPSFRAFLLSILAQEQ